ncbi:outer membrane lipoprotein carrier protein LolA [Xanthomonadaceae bacterium JHOS43]|nr:outer membrane lipoprotein carrier protein LolA [Xanthomonadaceae bacterium JHOS43]MCX7563551.1 outer membrane lipoprotein carrier protein LolA [Xanthomonadaceae bacterium XH05]
MLRATMLSLVVLIVSGTAAARDPRATLSEFTQGLEGLSGRFEQHVFDPGDRLNEESRGSISLAVPRQFRWEYETPFPQLIVADGQKVWIYDPDLEQVQVRPQGAEEQQSPLTALIDPSELDRQFTVSDEGDEEGLVWVGLEPKGEDAPFSRARLGFSGDELARMEMTDALGQRTRITFSGWQRNPAFDAGTFRFVPPPGVDVIGDMAEAAQAFPVGD